MDQATLDLIQTLAKESIATLTSERQFWPDVDVTHDVWALVRNTLLVHNINLLTELRKVYGKNAVLGEHSGWELKEMIYKIVLACMAFVRMAHNERVAPWLWPKFLTLTMEDGAFLPIYRAYGRFMDATTMQVSKLRLLVALACCAARHEKPWTVVVECSEVTINVVTILFSTTDMTVLFGSGQSECAMALMGAFDGTTPPYVVACNILTAHVAAVDLSLIHI